MENYASMDYDYDESFEESPLLDADDSDSDNPIDLGQLYQSLSNNSIDIKKRLELFSLIQNQLQIGNIAPARIAAYHTQLCVDLVSKFNTRTGVGELETHEKILIPMLEFLQEVFMNGDRTFVAITLKSQLLSNLVKLVIMFADRIEDMTKNLVRNCGVDTVLGHAEVVAPHEILRSLIDVPDIPEVFYGSNVCKVIEMQHRYDCECPDCKGTPDRPPTPANPFMLYSEASAKDNRDERQHSDRFVPGQLVAFATESLSWMNYDPSTSYLPPLPPYMRGFVVGKCPVRLNNPQVGVWVPDFALCALCVPEKLTLLSEFSNVRTFTPLVYIAAAYPHTSTEVVSFAICLIHDMLLKNAKRDSVRQLLEGKFQWKTLQLLRFLDSGEAKTKLLAIINIVIHNEKDDRGCKAVYGHSLHNTLADWLVWKAFTQSMPELEKSEILEGLMLLIPRIEVRKWPRRPLVLQGLAVAQWMDAMSSNITVNLTATIRMAESDMVIIKIIVPRAGIPTWDMSTEVASNPWGSVLRRVKIGATTELEEIRPMGEKLGSTVLELQGAWSLHHLLSQPILARLMCGMLNSGGGDIYIGLIEGLVQGVHAPRPERDSFTQEYCLEPRLPPHSFQVERRLVLRSADHVPDCEWNRFVFTIRVSPQQNVVYQIVPEKQSFIRRPPEGTTVILTSEDDAGDCSELQ
ncbi:hypothetical protein B566_EDAN001089 [Ephemera danica]|nr:hypothetical protein B566_EDAN001089 [Ephemera danica]